MTVFVPQIDYNGNRAYNINDGEKHHADGGNFFEVEVHDSFFLCKSSQIRLRRYLGAVIQTVF